MKYQDILMNAFLTMMKQFDYQEKDMMKYQDVIMIYMLI